MNSSDGVDRLISILGDALSRSRAQRLLSDAGGNVETAVNAYFSDPTPSLESATPRARLQALLGNLISQRRLDDLLAASGGNLERAVDIHFSSAGIPYSLHHCMKSTCQSCLERVKICFHQRVSLNCSVAA